MVLNPLWVSYESYSMRKSPKKLQMLSVMLTEDRFLDDFEMNPNFKRILKNILKIFFSCVSPLMGREGLLLATFEFWRCGLLTMYLLSDLRNPIAYLALDFVCIPMTSVPMGRNCCGLISVRFGRSLLAQEWGREDATFG